MLNNLKVVVWKKANNGLYKPHSASLVENTFDFIRHWQPRKSCVVVTDEQDSVFWAALRSYYMEK